MHINWTFHRSIVPALADQSGLTPSHAIQMMSDGDGFFELLARSIVKFHRLIDVRSPDEFARGHLAGAINLPLEQLAQRVDSIEGVEKSSALVIYCQSGARSAIACSYLVRQGYTQVANGGAMMGLLMQIKGAITPKQV